jgi:hypothetical protein
MPNPPDREQQPVTAADADTVTTEITPRADAVTTEITTAADPDTDPRMPVIERAAAEKEPQPERRFTAPSAFDAGMTQQINTPAEPETAIFSLPGSAGSGETPAYRGPGPQVIPPRGGAPRIPRTRRSWGWVVALVLVIAAVVALAVLGTVLLTHAGQPKASQEDLVRSTIHKFDIAVQTGDLAALRGITCGGTRDSYVKYNDQAFAETFSRVSAARQYPVVASIDQVVVSGDHAEANVTSFMAYAPQTRSTRSFDLQFRDNEWKICEVQ